MWTEHVYGHENEHSNVHPLQIALSPTALLITTRFVPCGNLIPHLINECWSWTHLSQFQMSHNWRKGETWNQHGTFHPLWMSWPDHHRNTHPVRRMSCIEGGGSYRCELLRKHKSWKAYLQLLLLRSWYIFICTYFVSKKKLLPSGRHWADANCWMDTQYESMFTAEKVFVWLINWSIDWTAHWLIDWLIDWSIEWVSKWVSEWVMHHMSLYIIYI